MKRIALTFIAVMLCQGMTFGWGNKGHDVIAAIAHNHLTPKAAKAVRKSLGGRSMVYYSSWMDNIRNDDAYAFTATWHYANLDHGYTYETMPKEERGDVITATGLVIEMLKERRLDDSLRTMYTKMLIHLVGDLHCPMHAGHLSDLGGNRNPITFFGNTTNLHSLWDTPLIDAARSWSHTEWMLNLDIGTPGYISAVCSGSLIEWFGETAEYAKTIYDNTPQDRNLSYDYVNRFAPVVEEQLYKGGLRLASLLNMIYK